MCRAAILRKACCRGVEMPIQGSQVRADQFSIEIGDM
jgi:hypothetical protein